MAAATRLPPTAAEQPVHLIPLDGPAAASQSELSGLAWHGDTLILLPQYPGRFGNGEDGALFALDKADILAFLDGDSATPLVPRPIPFLDSGLAARISGFEGFEAIAFHGDRVFLTVEARPGPGMMGYLVAGEATPDLSAIRLDPGTLAEIPPQAGLSNMSDEALVLADGLALTMYEANGARVNPAPVVHGFDVSGGLQPAGSEPFPTVEYRITDATAPDAAGRFWAINYLFPGDLVKLVPAEDQVAETFGIGASHVGAVTVERLLEFQVAGDGITFSGSPPLWLSLSEEDGSRNWEGVVRLDDRGFLLVTDSFPETLFAFVPLP